ncbi:hypothetical protein [uncultured Aquitalea sp.]|uniref:hypothetical protein n=1 Tax=uncultured Aquitalea sp. TaxID=540272 RepID=UPI0025ED2C8B|nr:hypothetical protein [uncultured Aquitalea sp.]
MNRFSIPACLAALLLSAGLSLPAQAYTDEGRLPFVGQPGELPAELALRFVHARLGQHGRFDYRTLSLVQQSEPEAFDSVRMEIVRDGLMDDSLAAVRQRLALDWRDGAWRIVGVEEDFRCRRGEERGWTRRPCP